jgi:hypothetical protein
MKQSYHPHGNQPFNRQLGTPSPRLKVLYHKSEKDLDRLRGIWMVYEKSEKDLDRLLQVKGGFGSSTSSWRRTSQHPLKGSCSPRLLGLHQQRHTFTKWPPRPDGTSILVGRAGHRKGMSPPSYPAQSTLLTP